MPKPSTPPDDLRPTIAAYKAEAADNNIAVIEHEQAVKQFELELKWCIEDLERQAGDKRSTHEKLDDTWEALQMLKSKDQPVIYKRLLMRSYCGDYTARMAAAGKKLKTPKPKNPIPVQTKSSLLRKSASAGDSTYKTNNHRTPIKTTNSKPSLLTRPSISKSSFTKVTDIKSPEIMPSESSKSSSYTDMGTISSTASTSSTFSSD